MELIQLYDSLFNQAIRQISRGEVQIDRKIDDNGDRRRGLTLLIRPSDDIKVLVRAFQDEMLNIEGEQYYQPISDLHVTALSIISCYEGFDIGQVHIPDYEYIISQSLEEIPKTKLTFKGITATREAVMIQGFPMDEGLEMLRDRLRNNFKSANLQQSMDSRYRLTTAHMTSVRFRKELQSPSKFANLLHDYRKVEFGEMRIESLELVYNDWYQNSNIVKTLRCFSV
ncbi:2'-5' RNA ligase family protein [Sphingobacterium prati]|uniref:2'-5' RNA ligase family protein n=1 Tax=Sphingobacterium prati TaxID=2737006 RepID=UPI001551A8B3|nr:mutarotase [Sphingobacterium prati]NPE45950.1 mutarotase [Sphingobacterium prati]